MAVEHMSTRACGPPVRAPASNHIIPTSHLLPSASLPQGFSGDNPEPNETVASWLASINENIKNGLEESDLSNFFLEDSFWRDLLCLSWDFRTLHGREQIASYVKGCSARSRTLSFSLDISAGHKEPALTTLDFDGNVNCLQAWLDIETDLGRGKAIVKLAPDSSDHGTWKAFTLLTTLQELKGHEESIRGRRPTGAKDAQDQGSANWKDRRIAEQNFEDGREPAVLILGVSNLSRSGVNVPNPLTLFRRRSRGFNLSGEVEAAWGISVIDRQK